MSDIDLVTKRLRGLIGPDQHPQEMMVIVHEGAPISKARARWSKASKFAYTPKRTTDAQKSLAWRFKAAMKGRAPAVCNVAVIAIFFRQNLQRIDADNLMKLVMDAGTEGGLWRDDCQVSAQAALVELDRARPRTVIALCPYESSLKREPTVYTCRICTKTYERPYWQSKRFPGGSRFCSVACAQSVKRTPATCPRCNKSFQRKTAGQRYCSSDCANKARSVRLPNGEQRPPAVCEKCGKEVSKRGYQQCRECRGFGRPRKQQQEESQ